jgi:hypothetical protein
VYLIFSVMSKENSKNSNPSETVKISDLVTLPAEEVVLVEQVEQVAQFLTYFIITPDDTVQEDIRFMEEAFEDLCSTKFMNKIHNRKGFIGVIKNLKTLHEFTSLVTDHNVEQLDVFLKQLREAIIRNNPKKVA